MSHATCHRHGGGCRNPVVCHIVPPHILKHLAQTASDPQVQRSAARALSERKQAQQARELAGGRARALRAPAAATRPGAVKTRSVYDARNTVNPQLKLVRGEGDSAVGDAAADEAYGYSGVTWDFFQEVFERDSIDGAGLELISAVHYRRGYNNAFWNGEQMVYGDGDGLLFTRFTVSLDVVGHELTHGVTQYTADLRYRGQSGALNESFSDVFGSLIKQRVLDQTADQASWLIGEGLLVPKAGAVRTALRSMAAPGTAYDDPTPNGLGRDPQPGHMDDYVVLPEDEDNDWGGVHINSGIPNNAFHLVATALGGRAWERAGRIWYDTLTGGALGSNAQFADMRAATIDVARRSFGEAVARTVGDAWAEVGLAGETS